MGEWVAVAWSRYRRGVHRGGVCRDLWSKRCRRAGFCRAEILRLSKLDKQNWHVFFWFNYVFTIAQGKGKMPSLCWFLYFTNYNEVNEYFIPEKVRICSTISVALSQGIALFTREANSSDNVVRPSDCSLNGYRFSEHLLLSTLAQLATYGERLLCDMYEQWCVAGLNVKILLEFILASKVSTSGTKAQQTIYVQSANTESGKSSNFLVEPCWQSSEGSQVCTCFKTWDFIWQNWLIVRQGSGRLFPDKKLVRHSFFYYCPVCAVFSHKLAIMNISTSFLSLIASAVQTLTKYTIVRLGPL